MSELIMLVGLPGSGKSTYIKSINKDGKYTVISSDNIIDEIAAEKGISYTDAFSDHVGFATKKMFILAKQAINQGKPIIWDQTNMNVKNRKKKLEMFPDSYEKRAVVFSIDDLELKRRLKDRAEKTGKHIPDHVMKSMASSYQAPTKAEGFTNIKFIK